MLKIIDRFIGKAVTILVIVAYFQVFKFIVIPYAARVIFQVAMGALMLFLIILRSIYQPNRNISYNFKGIIIILIVSTVPSYFIAKLYHNQSFFSSIVANQIILFYLLYFFIHIFQVPVKFLIRTIVIIGLFVVSIYYLQFFSYPKAFLDIVMLEGRGTIRLLVPGMLCTQFAYYFFLHKFFENNKLRDLLLALLSSSIFILQGTRVLVFSMIFLTLIMLLFYKKVNGRFIKMVVIALASFIFLIVFRDIFNELFRESSSQVENLGGGVRLKAANFFITKFQSDGWTYLFGNSRAGIGEIYGKKLELYSKRYGFYITDIGILGDYILYGVIFVISGLLLLIKAIRFRIGSEFQYLKYYIFMQCFTLATGKGIFAGVDILILVILYVFDLDRVAKIQLEETKQMEME